MSNLATTRARAKLDDQKARRASNNANASGFAPAVCDESRVLVLGSLPGQASLAAGGYYAHPHNAFWRIMEDLLGVPRALPYAERLSALVGEGVALWDVCAAARRPGSLDAHIARDSIEAADIAGLLASFPAIALVVLNGGTAADLYRRLVAPHLDAGGPPTQTVPSTSPAHARVTYAEKRQAWAAAFLTSTAPLRITR